MRKLTSMGPRLVVAVFVCLYCIGVKAVDVKQYGIPNTQIIPIQDTQAKMHYELYIKLPEGHSDKTEINYPVVYFTDAVWHIELLSAATAFLMEDVILVGISWQKDIDSDLLQSYGSHVSRFRDYSFWTSSNPAHPKLQFGQANNHLTFIRNDVFNYIERNYRTDTRNRTYFGYSLGGLFGAYTLLVQPNTFKNYILGSPSVQLLEEHMSKTNVTMKEVSANVFISHGDLEEDRGDKIEAFVASLAKNNNNALSIKHAIIEGDHQTAFPITGVSSIKWLSKLQNTGGKS